MLILVFFKKHYLWKLDGFQCIIILEFQLDNSLERKESRMGGCCCSSRGAELDVTAVYYHCPREPEEHESLSSVRGTSSATGLLVDTNLEISIPDTYRAPPTPLPYDVDSHPTVGADGRFESSDVSEALEKSDVKIKTDPLIDSSKLLEDEPPKLKNEAVDSAVEEEDVCPICLEEYDVENPRILTKCEHHFHLSCILEWMERSDTCPMCEQVMVIDHTPNG